MYGKGIFLAFAVLLVIAHARPDGYGVKGGGHIGHHRSTANAFASAHATANADTGGFGIAQSSATATANADSRGGGTSRADATANASANGENIGKAISENENRNVNGLVGSGDLEESNDRGKDTEYKWISHVDGTASSSHPIANSEHAQSGADYHNLGLAGQGHDHRGCSEVPEGLKEHGGVSRCGDKTGCNGNKSFPPGSHHPVGIDGGYGGNVQKPGNAGGIHAGSPCAPGDSKCFANKPSVSIPYPTYDKNPDSSAGSSSSVGIDGGYGGNAQKPGNSGGSPCAPGDSKCFAHKPSVSIPYPTYDKNPDSSAGSSSSVGIDGGYGGNAQKPGNSGGSPCVLGDSKCFANKPSVSIPYPTYDKNPDSSAGSSSSVGIDGGYGGNAQKPGNSGGNSCAPGASKCLAHKPISSNTGHPGGSLGKSPDTTNPFLNGQIDLSGINDSQYSVQTSNPFLYPHSQVRPTTGSNHPVANGPYKNSNIPYTGGSTAGNDSPNTSCHGSCSPNKPAGSPSETPSSTNHGPKVEDNWSPGSANHQGEFPVKKPGDSNPFLVGIHSVKSESYGSSSLTPGNVQSGEKPLPGHGEAHFPQIVGGCQGGSSSTSCTGHKVSGESDVQGSIIHGHGNGETYSPKPQYAHISHAGSPCRPGDSKCFPDKSGSGDKPRNPFLNGQIDLSDIKHSTNSGEIPDAGVNHPEVQQNGKIPSSGSSTVANGSPITSCHGSVSCSPNKPAGSPSGIPISTNHGSKVEDNWSPGSVNGKPELPGKKPGESNPFLVGGHLVRPQSHGIFSETPEIVENCQGGSSSKSCTGNKSPGKTDIHDSMIQGHEGTFSTEDWGVKGHRTGVKGGANNQWPLIKLHGNSGLGETSNNSGNEVKGSAHSTANANSSASAESNAYASSSSSSSGSQSSANAKSEAYSSLDKPGSSNAWSSSSASASASAFASSSSSSSSHQNWRAPVFSQVPV